MKIYCFYLVKNKIDVNDYPVLYKDDVIQLDGKEVALYAFTPEKDSELYFLETRNMDIFYEKIINMDREEYEEFCDDNKERLLEYHAFNTKSIINKKVHVMMTYVLCTTIESDCILYYKEEYALDYVSDILNDEMLDILSTIRFKKKVRKALNDIFLLSEIKDKIYPKEDINYDLLVIDEISLYVKLFSNTLRK